MNLCKHNTLIVIFLNFLYSSDCSLYLCVFVCVPPVGDSMTYHNGQQFSTLNRDNDENSGGSCARTWGGGGWWFGNCHYANLNGQYGQGLRYKGITWYDWKYTHQSYKASRMLVRPVGHTTG